MKKKKNQNDYSFIEHLEELRKRIIFVIIFWTITSLISYFFSKEILEFLIIPLKKYQKNVIFTRPLEPFFSVLKICIFTGGIITLPYLIIQTYLFVLPDKTSFSIYFSSSHFNFIFLYSLYSPTWTHHSTGHTSYTARFSWQNFRSSPFYQTF